MKCSLAGSITLHTVPCVNYALGVKTLSGSIINRKQEVTEDVVELGLLLATFSAFWAFILMKSKDSLQEITVGSCCHCSPFMSLSVAF